MTELHAVCRQAAAERAAGRSVVLATVVRVEGSSYRRPGARMLVAEDRWLAGCVSGGCLEADVIRRASFRLRGGRPVVVRYDSRSDDDIGWGFGLGCNGMIEVLLERIEADDPNDPLAFAASCFATDRSGVILTVLSSIDGSVAVGARLLVRQGRLVRSSVPAGPAQEALLARATGPRREVEAAGVRALVEPIEPLPRAFVVGTRHDAVPVVRLAKQMGFLVTVVDAFDSVSLRERFREADTIAIVRTGETEALTALFDAPTSALVALMSHDYARDRAALGAAITSKALYVGALGPKRRTERMLAELVRGGVVVTDEALRRLHAPIGLDLGAETPQEIALAIVAEMTAALTGAPAGRLRSRGGPIHGAERLAPAAYRPDEASPLQERHDVRSAREDGPGPATEKTLQF